MPSENSANGMRGEEMTKAMWGVGWWFSIAGWFGIVVWPARVGLAMWQAGEVPSAVELVPLGSMIVIGVALVVLGKYLRRRFAG
jgi:membrane protein DedA with SNARE-associated domain